VKEHVPLSAIERSPATPSPAPDPIQPAVLPATQAARPFVPPSPGALRRFFLPYTRAQRAALGLLDVAVLFLAATAAMAALEPFAGDALGLLRALVFALVGALGFFAADCYDARGFVAPTELAARVILGILTALPANALAALAVPAVSLPAHVLGLASILAAATLLPVRAAADLALRRLGVASERIVLVGVGRRALECAAAIAAVEGPERVLGWVGPRGAGVPGWKRLGSYRALGPLAGRRGVTRAIVDPEALGPEGTGPALAELSEAGLPWVEAGELLERLTGRLDLSRLDPRLLVHANGLEVGVPEVLAVRRVFEMAASALLLVLVSPVLLAAAIAIKLESPGPAVFKQVRTGRGGRPFTIVKLRTMRADAEKAGAAWAQKNDPRVTKLGRFLRKTRLDELPQLWNVFRGDMSFVGPRPERPVFVEKIAAVEPAFRLRHVVRPGVTGWAQVRYRYGATLEDSIEKLRHDLYYVFRWSPLLDVEVILETFKVVLKGSNDH
jgi:exopolysaccharide biosynthesis polyprenyl glycosylphosphotransferase